MPVHIKRWTLPPPWALPWPLPALLAWALAWAVHALCVRALGLPLALAFALAAAAGLLCAQRASSRWRRLIISGGFPLSALALLGTPQMHPSLWLLAALPLLLAYPVRAWRDAPFFPTQLQALHGLERLVKLPQAASILDAGCGGGHGLRALQRVWPQARLHGVEWSRPLAFWSARAVPGASIRRGDMWAGSWAAHHLVYLFQRPESMARAWDKACAEMAPGSWLVSLEFAVPGVPPSATLERPGHKKAWVYRVVARA
jgi:hypothetical protein